MDKWIVKSEEVSDPKFGIYPGARKVHDLIKNGLVVIDKPSGPSSHQVTAWVRDMLELKKAGHAGTLDPKVTGVLVIALQNATKIMPALKDLPKEYIALMKLHKEHSMKEIENVVKEFKGKISQVPPVKSAVKRVKRVREIFEIQIIEKKERDLLLRVNCEAGTYIRKLISDMGKKLGGAHMQELRRIKTGPFSEDESFKLQELKDAYVMWKEKKEDKYIRKIVFPVERGIEHVKKIIIKDSTVNAICNGASLAVGGISRFQDGIEKNELVAILSLKGELVALGKAEKTSREILNSKRGIAAKTERVIMPKNTYPSSWKQKSQNF